MQLLVFLHNGKAQGGREPFDVLNQDTERVPASLGVSLQRGL